MNDNTRDVLRNIIQFVNEGVITIAPHVEGGHMIDAMETLRRARALLSAEQPTTTHACCSDHPSHTALQEQPICGASWPEDGGDLDGSSVTVCGKPLPCPDHPEQAPDIRQKTFEEAERARNLYHAALRAQPAQQQIDRLAQFIMNEVPGEPSQSEGAVDTAIRLLRSFYSAKADK